MHCTIKKTLQIGVESGKDVLVQVKANQPSLVRAATELSECAPPSDAHHHDEIGQRNRIESRRTSVWPVAPDQLSAGWASVRCLIRVQRQTELFSTTAPAWHSRTQTDWYLCTRELSAYDAHHAVRDHWVIENSLHHVRDVAMGEDASPIRHEPGVFAQLRTWALNLLRHTAHDNIRGARQTIGGSEQALLHFCQSVQR